VYGSDAALCQISLTACYILKHREIKVSLEISHEEFGIPSLKISRKHVSLAGISAFTLL